MFCAGVEGVGKDSCQGDSGGPIFTMTSSGHIDKQIGVVSWGEGCARADLPGVYAEVSSASEWIFDQVCALSSDKPDNCPEPTLPPTLLPPAEGEVAVTFKILTDNYPAETGWFLLDDMGDEVERVSAGSFTESYARVSTTLNLKSWREYTFTMTDSYGDGLFSPGNYEVTASGEVLASGAAYESSEVTKFVVPGTETPQPTSSGNGSSAPPTLLRPTDPPATPSPTVAASQAPISACIDTEATIYVDSVAGNQTCQWLSVNDRYNYLCLFVDVAVTCKFTCDWCELG